MHVRCCACVLLPCSSCVCVCMFTFLYMYNNNACLCAYLFVCVHMYVYADICMSTRERSPIFTHFLAVLPTKPPPPAIKYPTKRRGWPPPPPTAESSAVIRGRGLTACRQQCSLLHRGTETSHPRCHRASGGNSGVTPKVDAWAAEALEGWLLGVGQAHCSAPQWPPILGRRQFVWFALFCVCMSVQQNRIPAVSNEFPDSLIPQYSVPSNVSVHRCGPHRAPRDNWRAFPPLLVFQMPRPFAQPPFSPSFLLVPCHFLRFVPHTPLPHPPTPPPSKWSPIRPPVSKSSRSVPNATVHP